MRRTAGHRIRAGAALGVLALVLTACGGDGSSSPSTTPEESDGGGESSTAAGGDSTLTIWADGSASTAAAIEPLCMAWAEANGVTCKVKKFSGGTLEEELVRANDTGEVPDIFEFAHDRIGFLVDQGILAPVDISANVDQFSEPAVAAVEYQGNSYGVPWAVENIAMLTNKALAPECPGTLDEAVANAKKLIGEGKVTEGLGITMQIGENGDFYHWYPLFTADGGYAFGRNDDGTYNPDDLGIGSEGAIAAGERLQQLANEGVMKASVSYDIARETFAKGKSPYFITGPWQIPEQTEALGDDVMVCPIPGWEGSDNVAKPFLGVRVFGQTAQAKNATLASTFLNDTVMTTEFMDGMYAVDPRPPAWLESFEKAASDPFIKGFGEYGQQGEPMPSIVQMANVFADAGLSEYKIASGEDPAATLTKAAESINKANAGIG